MLTVLAGYGLFCPQARRAGMFVEQPMPPFINQPQRGGMVFMQRSMPVLRTLDYSGIDGSTNMPHLRRWGRGECMISSAAKRKEKLPRFAA